MHASMQTAELALAMLTAVAMMPAGGCDTPCKPERPALTAALARAGVTDPARALTHLSHVCDLASNRGPFHVVDVREVIPFMNAPRGINHIVIFDRELNVLRSFRYIAERPLRCYGNRLLLNGDATFAGDRGPLSGNVLVFTSGVETVEAERLDWSNPPSYAVPPD